MGPHRRFQHPLLKTRENLVDSQAAWAEQIVTSLEKNEEKRRRLKNQKKNTRVQGTIGPRRRRFGNSIMGAKDAHMAHERMGTA